jgi:hypothetical protein
MIMNASIACHSNATATDFPVRTRIRTMFEQDWP